MDEEKIEVTTFTAICKVGYKDKLKKGQTYFCRYQTGGLFDKYIEINKTNSNSAEDMVGTMRKKNFIKYFIAV